MTAHVENLTTGVARIPMFSDGDWKAIWAVECLETEERNQLWERVSHASLNSDALTPEQWERIATVRDTLGTRNTRRAFVRGPRVSRIESRIGS